MAKFPLLIFIFFLTNFDSDICLSIKTSKNAYTLYDKHLKWVISNNCQSQKYYLISIQIKTDTGWKTLNPYVHALMQKDMLALLTIGPRKEVLDQIQIKAIIDEQKYKLIDKRYNSYRLCVWEYSKKDLSSASAIKPSLANFTIDD